ncbi:MAG TPA: SDR family oxidoreductase [Bryobacteraceae bacterium]|nr:SDR family oxidoreductase [Bryobacteraceae bacterium]
MPQPNEFAGLTALVTGASNGIGAETTVALGRSGARVLVHYNQAAEQASAVLQRAGGTGELIQADLSRREGVHALIDRIRGRAVDILINNAGSLVKRTRVLEFTEELWDEVMMLNLTSAFFLAQAVLPGMVERGRGVIVNVSSVAAKNGGGIGALAYATAKAALSTMTKGLAKEFASQGVRCNTVSPGTIDTNYHRTFSTQQMLKAVTDATPLGRLGTSQEVAHVILFLCSKESSFIHGQSIEVNGGFLMA